MALLVGLSLIELKFSRAEKIFIAAVTSIFGLNIACDFFGEWMSAIRIFSMAAFVFVAVYLFAVKLNNFRVGILIVMMLAIGATVNPIAHGIDCIYEIPVGKKIAEIARNDKSLWLVEDDRVSRNGFPIMFDAPTINSVNVYPVLDRWKKLDPTRENFKFYNRYAHIKINPADLPKLDVRYILSPYGDLEKFSTSAVKITKLYEDAGSHIYKVN